LIRRAFGRDRCRYISFLSPIVPVGPPSRSLVLFVGANGARVISGGEESFSMREEMRRGRREGKSPAIGVPSRAAHRHENDYTRAGSILIKPSPAE